MNKAKMELFPTDDMDQEDFLLSCLDPETGEILPHRATAFEQFINISEEDRERKIFGYAYGFKNLKMFLEDVEKEIHRLYQLKDRVRLEMEDKKKVVGYLMREGEKFSNPIRKTTIYFMRTESAQVENPNALPELYKKITVEPRLSEIKNALREGVELPGCSIKESKALVIR
jgi:hypothetical protein